VLSLVTKSFYELLGVDPAAPAEEIKRAFRQEIARYHPDKVQHLGQEFQDMAANRAAELTEAYRTLMDQQRRSEYDLELQIDDRAAPAPQLRRPPDRSGPPPVPPADERTAASATQHAGRFTHERARRDEFVRKAAMERFRQALAGEFGPSYEQPVVNGFEITGVSKARMFSKRKSRVLARFVARVDAPAITESWQLASKMPAEPDSEVCVFLLASDIAPASELAEAIAEQRKRSHVSVGGRVVIVPLDARDWQALVPTDAPEVCKSLLTRLKAAM
jgi:curved DNA-binding protein CbpA